MKDADELQEAIAAGASVLAKDNAGRTALDYLSASACGKPLIRLPPPGLAPGGEETKIPCPPHDDAFLKSQNLLVSAMKRETAAKH